MDKKIISLIRAHHALTLATAHERQPYCSTVFYAFMEEEQCFVFSSSEETAHIRHIHANPEVAANIFLETKMVGKVQGLQITGTVYAPDEAELKRARTAYFQRFPYALVANPTLWILKPTWAKLTDNRLGFGKKIIWERT